MPGSDGGRFPRDVRWPARLATALADEAEVIAEGLNGRTATIESPVAEGRNGLPYLVPCLRSHAPVDLLVIYLGTNDAYWLEPIMVARSIGRLVKVARAAEAGPWRGQPPRACRLPATVRRAPARASIQRGLRPTRLRTARSRRCRNLQRPRRHAPRGGGTSRRRGGGRGTHPQGAPLTGRTSMSSRARHSIWAAAGRSLVREQWRALARPAGGGPRLAQLAVSAVSAISPSCVSNVIES